MSEKTKSSLDSGLLFIITVMLAVIGYFYIDETKDQQTIDTTQTKDIGKLLEITNSQNDRLIRVETKLGLY